MNCFTCQSAIGPDDSWCSRCGAAVRQRVDPDSERRFVTILRADVIDSTGLVAEFEPEEAVSRLEPALAAMRAAVRQFGGIVSKELGDGLAASLALRSPTTTMRPLPAMRRSSWSGASAVWGSRAPGPGRSPLRPCRCLHGRQRIFEGLRDRRRRPASGRAAGDGSRGEPDLRVRSLPEACGWACPL